MALYLQGFLLFSLLCIASSAIVPRKHTTYKLFKKAVAPKSNANGPCKVTWTQINQYPICYEGHGNKYGTFHHMKDKGLVGAIKLVYRKGFIRCVANPAYDSRWGCYHYSTFIKYPLNIIITDKYNNIIFPKQRFIKHAAGLWYYLPMVDDKHSDELVFTDFGEPFYLGQYDEMRIWYGEDLKNWSEGDNQGRVCVDVYAAFM